MTDKPHSDDQWINEWARSVALKNAIYEVNSSIITDQEAIEILAKIDAVDPLRKVAP